jgi:hypothetical protein
MIAIEKNRLVEYYQMMNLPMRKRYLFLYIILFFFACTNSKNEVKDASFRGVITDKYNNFKSHGQCMYNIYSKNNEDLCLYAEDFPKLWEFAEIGDSVIKIKDSLKIEIKKKNGMSRTFYADFRY